MFTKQEKKNFNTEFWTSFGVYMKKHNVRYGRVKWVNYKSNIKDVYFRLDINPKKAAFAIELQHTDDGIRALFYEQFIELKTMLNNHVDNQLIWEELAFNKYQQPISRMYIELPDVSIYNKDDWQSAFQFFEKKMTGLHEFWEEFSEIFKNLED